MNMLFSGLKIAFFQNKASLNYLIMSDAILTRIMEAKKREVGRGAFPYQSIYVPILG